MNKVLGIGNALVDILFKLENEDLLKELKLAKGSMQLVDSEFKNLIFEKTKHLSSSQASGGSAANTIHGLASLGVETAYIGKVGEDLMGEYFVADLEKNNIKTFLKHSNSDTGVAAALISPDSERTFGTYLGAAVEISAADLDQNIFKQYNYFHIEGYLVFNQDLIEKALIMAKSCGMIVSLDLASYNVVEANLDFLRNITSKYVDIVFANEEEAKAFTGKMPEEALDEIATMCSIAVVKIGKNGSLIKKGTEKFTAGAISANVIDTTGAGDLYAAGFIYGMIQNLSLDKCGQIGALCAGKVIEEIGAKISDDTWKLIRSEVKSMC